jgi:hypothetical protein
MGFSAMIAYRYFTLPDEIDMAYIAAKLNWRIVEIIGENAIAAVKVEFTFDD